jgi:hypothetical protein
MRTACWITKITHTHSEYVTLIAFHRRLCERVKVLPCMYTACLVDYWKQVLGISWDIRHSRRLRIHYLPTASLKNWQTPYSRDLVEKLTFPQLINKLSVFYGNGSLTAGKSPPLFRIHSHINQTRALSSDFTTIHFNIILYQLQDFIYCNLFKNIGTSECILSYNWEIKNNELQRMW